MTEGRRILSHEPISAKERPTLERLIEHVKKEDELYSRFVSWVSKRAPDHVPQRGDSKDVQREKNSQLVKDYLRYVSRMFLPRNKDDSANLPLQSRRVEDLSNEVSSKLVVSKLPEEYARFQQAVREAVGQAFDPSAELARVQEDQRASLVEWLERLTQYDHYTPAFQYLLFRTILSASSHRNGPADSPRFQLRDANTVAPLPQFHEQAVGHLEDVILAYDETPADQKDAELDRLFQHPFFGDVAGDTAWKDRIKRYLQKNAINELYAAFSDLVTEYKEYEGPVIGRWITVTANGIADELTEKQAKEWEQSSLTAKGNGAGMLARLSSATPWCLARPATAESYLRRGHLLIFLENTPKGVRPAFGIAFNDKGTVYEARGANDRQELNPRYADIVDARMKKDQPPGWEKYQERLQDARVVAEAERFLNNPKLKSYEELKPEDQERYRKYLRAIYEVDRKLVGFGYGGENAYAKKLLARRDINIREDIDIMFDGKVLFGPLDRDLWKEMDPSIEYIFTVDEIWKLSSYQLKKMLEKGPVKFRKVTVGTMSKQELAQRLEETSRDRNDAKGILISPVTSRLSRRPDFEVSKTQEEVDLIELLVADLAVPGKATYGGMLSTEEIYARAADVGLELCPPEVALQLRLQYTDQPRDERLLIGMTPMQSDIMSSDKRVFILELSHTKMGLWFKEEWTGLRNMWKPTDRFVFKVHRNRSND
ncbi:MAG: hypothetical protein WA021_04240 [Minisyncoccia bacterium]